MSRLVPVVVLLGAVVLAAAGLITLAVGDSPDYADLAPVPDSIVWEQDQETTVWVNTNRHAVELSVSSIGLGIGGVDLRDPSSGETSILGEGLGCLEAVVSGVDVTNITDNSALIEIELDRQSTGTGLDVHWHLTQTGVNPVENVETGVTGDSTNIPLSSLAGGTYRIGVSLNAQFPTAITRTVTFTTGEAESGTSDHRGQDIHVLEDMGVTLIACAEVEDVAITLYGTDDEELNRYLVDISPPGATPVPTSTPVPGPAFSTAYETLRFCPDAETPRADILTGAEAVGTVTAAGTGTLAYSLAPDGESRDFAFFEVSSAGSITVSDSGADNHTGIDGSRLYTFVVRATDDGGRVGEALVAVQVDLANPSTSRDGVCT